MDEGVVDHVLGLREWSDGVKGEGLCNGVECVGEGPVLGRGGGVE
jgi:hypothetical protein